MSEQIGAVLIFVGLFLATSGLLVFIFRSLRVLLGRTERRKLLGPAALLAAGLVIGSVPFAAQRLYFSIVGLAERERVVDGRQALVLTDTRITDAGLHKLQELKQLESLRIARTAVTPEGVAAFLADAPPTFREIDVTGNNIPTSILRKWKNAAKTGDDAPPGEGKAAAPERRSVN